MRSFCPCLSIPSFICSKQPTAGHAGSHAVRVSEICREELADEVSIASCALKAMGWVDIRHGGGTFVSKTLPIGNEAEEDRGGMFDQSESLHEVLEVRKYIEIGCASLTAQRRSEQNLQELRQILSHMEDALGNEEESEESDIRFHLEIARASNNSLLFGMMESLAERLQDNMSTSRRLWFFAERASAEQLLQEHREIFEAIEIRDEQLAAEKMMKHIQKVDDVVKGLVK